MNHTLISVIGVIGYLMINISVQAGPTPVLDVIELTNEADLICKGEVVNTVLNKENRILYKTYKLPKVEALFRADQVIKGQPEGETITIEFPSSYFSLGLAPENLQKGEYCLVFLKKIENSVYRFATFHHGKLPISRSRMNSIVEKDSLKKRIEMELINSLRDANPTVVLSSTRQLGKMKSRLGLESLEKLADNDDVFIRVEAIIALLRIGSPAGISAGLDFLEIVERSREIENLKKRVCYAFEEITDPALVPNLAPLLQSNNFLLRRGVIRALRFMRDTSTVPCLVKALDDNDSEVRYNAVIGIAETTGKMEGGWGPAVSTFRSNETKYIQHWKNWWSQGGKSKYSKKSIRK